MVESAFSFSLSGLEREERRIGIGARETVVDATPPSATERNTSKAVEEKQFALTNLRSLVRSRRAHLCP